MFGSACKCVEAHVRDHPQVAVRTDRVIGFDVTNGAIDGCCYLFFGEGQDAPTLVAKTARTPAGRAVFETEHRNLETLETKGLNDERRTVPAALGRLEDGDTLVTLQSALDGELMKNVSGADLFSAPRCEKSLDAVVEWWLLLQRCFGTRAVTLSGDVHAREVLQPLERYLRRYLVEPDEAAFLTRRYETERALEGVTLPLMVRHGDFCTANVVLQERGVGVFDWEFPLEHRLPLFDLFYFFSSVRFPYTGRRGESSHLDSFASVYWDDSYFRSAMRNCLRRAAELHGVPRETLGDLLVLALVHVANMKYDGLLASHGIAEGDDRSERARHARWERFGHPDHDQPFARIHDGMFEQLRMIAARGLPEL